MIEMSNGEYSKLCDNLFSKFKAGEITAEEVRDEWNKVDGIVFADPRPVNRPTDILKEIEDKKQNDNANKDIKQTSK